VTKHLYLFGKGKIYSYFTGFIDVEKCNYPAVEFQIQRPPSTSIQVPVTMSASSEHKNSAAFAMSCG
jgi:hypothetical protein